MIAALWYRTKRSIILVVILGEVAVIFLQNNTISDVSYQYGKETGANMTLSGVTLETNESGLCKQLSESQRSSDEWLRGCLEGILQKTTRPHVAGYR